MRPDDSIAAQAMVKYVKEELKLGKLAILHDSDAFGTGGADLVEKGAKDSGLAVSRREKYSTGDNDYTPQLLNIKNSAPDIMVLYGTNASDDGKIIKQFRQLGLGFKILGSPSVAQNITINLAGQALNGVYVAVDYVPASTDVSKSYADAYRKKYSQAPDDLSAWAYDSLYIFAKAISAANTVDKAKVRSAIAAIKNEKRVIGTVTFDKFGNGLHSVSIVSMQDGQKQLRKVVSVPIPQ
jgi:branched-chain amino acid transport system substrate-binding protein